MRKKGNERTTSIQEWKALYDAAIEFKEIKCWNWMWESDIFGIQNPENGETGYCCVMGNAGEHFALAVYLGSEGLDGYLKIRSGKFDQSPLDMLNLQKCLMASFEDRDFLRKEDFQVINRLGLKFRGHSSWPLFRSYRPAYYPWFITAEEARFLTLGLMHAIDISLRFKDNPERLTSHLPNRYLVLVPKKDESGLSWREEWLKPLPFKKTEITAKPLDANRIEEIKRKITQRRGIWETDFFYFPNPVKEKAERPYYPQVILWVEHNSGFILNQHLGRPPECLSEFQEQFLKFSKNINSLPEEIWVKREETLKLLEPIASELGMKLKKVKRLRMLEEAQAGMFTFFGG